MGSIKRTTGLFYCVAMALTAAGGPARAQQTATTVVRGPQLTVQWLNCRDNYEHPAAYSHCALRIQQGDLEQGDNHVVVSRRRVFRPLNLEKFVVGDAAERYAKSYHRAEMWRSGLVGAGAVLVAGAIASRYLCPDGATFCVGSADGPLARHSTLYAGAGLLAVSIPFRIAAHRAAHRSIDTYNASLGR